METKRGKLTYKLNHPKLTKNEKTICKWDFRKFYRKATRDNIPARLQDYENDRIIRLFVKKLKQRLVENRSGVHIKRIGYFYVHMIPFNLFKRFLTPNRYQIAFIPTDKSIFKYWAMDRYFSASIKNAVIKRLKEGYRYLNMIRGVTRTDYFYLGCYPKVMRQHNRTMRNKKLRGEF